MARLLRSSRVGGWYHITSRGNDRKAIFRDDRDRLHWCETVGRMVDQFRVVVHGYVLMANHYHLFLEVPEGNLSQAVQWLNVSYAAWFNRRHDRAGHLFQGRFESIPVEPQGWGWELTRYLHLNPVRTVRLGLGKAQRQADRAGVGAKPRPEAVQARLGRLRAYRWSSYRAYIGTDEPAPWLTVGRVLAMGSGRRHEARERYRRYVEAAVRQGLEPTPWASLTAGLVLGSQRFLAEVLGARKDRKTSAGPLRPRPGWAQVVTVVERARGEDWEQFRDRHGDLGRGLVLTLARRHGGLGLRELGELAGLRSAAAVNLAIRRYAARLKTDRIETKRAQDCAARLEKEAAKC